MPAQGSQRPNQTERPQGLRRVATRHRARGLLSLSGLVSAAQRPGITIPPVSGATPDVIVGVASAAMMGAPERALCQCLNYLDKPFVPLAVALRSMLAETRRKFSPQHQPRSRGSSRGPRCCVSGLRRNREPSSQHSCAVIQIGAPALVHHWSQRAASGWPHRAG